MFTFSRSVDAIGAKSHDEMIRSHDYEKLKEELLGRKALFKDEAFPHEKHGEYFTQGRLAGKEVKWLRPHDICPEPHFIEGGATKLDIAQGKLSDCWFIGKQCCFLLFMVRFSSHFEPPLFNLS